MNMVIIENIVFCIVSIAYIQDQLQSLVINRSPSCQLNPLNPHAAPKHHSASLKNDLISHIQGFRMKNFDVAILIETIYFFNLPPTSSHLHPLQVENCESNSRLIVDEGKFRLERVKNLIGSSLHHV